MRVAPARGSVRPSFAAVRDATQKHAHPYCLKIPPRRKENRVARCFLASHRLPWKRLPPRRGRRGFSRGTGLAHERGKIILIVNIQRKNNNTRTYTKFLVRSRDHATVAYRNTNGKRKGDEDRREWFSGRPVSPERPSPERIRAAPRRASVFPSRSAFTLRSQLWADS